MCTIYVIYTRILWLFKLISYNDVLKLNFIQNIWYTDIIIIIFKIFTYENCDEQQIIFKNF